MRLWSIHPKYLDSKGLVAAWREGLLAQAVLAGRTRGYRDHPQLQRFRDSGKASQAIAAYLREILAESLRRGYGFDGSKIEGKAGSGARIDVSAGQLEYEFELLKWKLAKRDKRKHEELLTIDTIEPNGAFGVREGGIEAWERIIPEIRAAAVRSKSHNNTVSR